MPSYTQAEFFDSINESEANRRMSPNLRYGAREAMLWLTAQEYEKDPNRENFGSRPGRGANGESSN